jgi:hypothetical protein
MTDKQLNKLMMLKLVSDCMNENAESVATVPALAEGVAALNDDIGLLQNTAERKATITVGKTDIKHDAEETLIKQVKVMSAVLSAWSTRNKRLDTKALAAIRDYEVRAMRDEVLIRHARVLLAEAVSAGPDLAHFGMPEAKVEEFRQRINAFEKALVVRDTSVSTRTLSRSELEVVFTRISSLLLNELDPLMELFKASNPHFYESYHSLRSVKALATRYRSSGKTDPAANGNGNQASPAAGSSNTPVNGNGAHSSNGGAPVNGNSAQASNGGAPVNNTNAQPSYGGAPVSNNNAQSSNGGAPVNGNNAQVPSEGAANGNGHAAASSAGAANTNGSGAPAAPVPNHPAGASPEPASSVPAPAADQPAAASFIG